jgi:hypothetical protein
LQARTEEMKFSFPVTCGCGETFSVNVSGTQFPKTAHCPNCSSSIWLVEPLGNVVGMAILGRAATEVQRGDSTLAIVLGAMAVECDMAYLFMKWKGIDLMGTKMPGDDDRNEWERQWREDVRTVASRFDKVSGLLAGQTFDSFLAQNSGLLKPLHKNYPASKSEPSPKKFFIRELFHKRNRIVHFGEIDFPQADAEMCLTLATTLSQVLSAMDAQRRLALDAKHASTRTLK